VIDLVNDRFVPVWVNIREEKVPAADALRDYEWDLVMNDKREIGNWWYYLFFVRSYIISPDLKTLLNDEEGLWGHITMRASPYLEMLNASLGRQKARAPTPGG
jgi:hypothetical protein